MISPRDIKSIINVIITDEKTILAQQNNGVAMRHVTISVGKYETICF